MRLPELLSKLSSRGIKLWAEGDRLRFRAPDGALTPDLREALVGRKAEILALLRDADTVTGSAALPLQPVSQDQPLALSFAQQRLWFLDQLADATSTYNISRALRLRGGLNVSALRLGFAALVERHQSLRMCFPKSGGAEVEVRELPSYDPLETTDLSDLAEHDREEAVQRLGHDHAIRPFDLERGPLLRVNLLVLGAQEWVLLLNIHHIVFDGWSFNVLRRELSQLYSAFNRGEQPVMEPLTVQYADYAAWQRQWLQGETLRASMAFWDDYLAGIPELIELPTDSPRPAIQQHQGAAVSVLVDRECTEGLRQLARESGCTLFMVLEAALAVLLSRFSGCRDIVIGTPVASRPRRELESLIGLFVNTLVLRTRLRDEESFTDLLARVRRGTLDAFAHQEIPFELLVERLNPKRSLSHHPVFQVMLNLFNVEHTGWNLPGVQIEQHGSGDRGLAKFDINLGVAESAQGLAGRLDYDASLFRRDTMVFLGQCLSTLLQQVPANATRPLSALSLLSDAWWREVADSQARQPRPAVAHRPFGKAEVTLVERFLAQVERYPHDLAVVAPEQRWTYRQLDERARQLAAALFAAPPGEPWSALLLPHDAAMVVGILGSLMAGRAYVPLDAAQPDARLRSILADTQANTLVCNSATRARAQVLATPETVLIDLDHLDCEPAAELPSIDPDAPAYLLFTSGSTGRPKGVMQTHRKVLHFIRQYSDHLCIAHQDRLLQLTRYGFDGGVLDSFSALLNGATLYPFDLRQHAPKACVETIAQEQITVYHSSPSFFRELAGVLDRPLDSVRLVVLGGEAAMRRDFLAWRDRFSTGGVFVNFYSQTESSVTTVQVFDQAEIERERVPIGFPIEDTEVTLAAPESESDTDAELFGEIVIQSPHLAAGYWKRESDAFSVPAEQDVPQRYRTGDLARRLPDGSLEFLGRLDHQVKLRGFRIELGEIESVLSADPGVSEAVVMVREDRQDDRRLVAYVVLDQHRPAVIDALRRTLAERLPDYMLPNAFVPLDALPLNANGKVDRLALPAPELDRSAVGRAYAAPSTPLEETLADLWQEVLMLNEPPGVDDDFFDLGGHSLLSAHLVSRIEGDLGLALNLVQFFNNPTIAGIARTLEQEQTSIPVSKSPPPNKPAEQTQLAAWSHATELHSKILGYSGSWRGERKTPESLVVGRNTSGTRPPLFWVFQGQLELVQLATYLGKDQPLYGMRSGHLVMEYTEDNIQALAIGYVREIEARCPKGPLFVGGNCQGGRIALAIAQHLVRRTRRIPLLFLMEWTYLPTPYAGPVAFLFRRESDFANPYVRFHYPELTWRCAFVDFRVEIVAGVHGQFFREPNVQVLAQTIQRCMATSLLRPPSMLPAEARRAEIQVLDPPHELTQGSHYLLNVRVANPTEVAWPSGEASGLMVTNRWVSAGGALLCELDACVPLPPLAPGESRSVNLPVLTPAVSETVELLATVTQEGVRSRNAGFGNLRVPIKLVEERKVLLSPAPDLPGRYGGPILIIGESDAANREMASLVRAQDVFVLGEAEQSNSPGIANAAWLRRLLPYWNKELPEIVRRAVVIDLGDWLDAAFASQQDAKQSTTWAWVDPAHALSLPILLGVWPQLRVIQILCDTPETGEFRETEQWDMLAPVVLNRDELVLPPAERSVRIRKHLSSTLAVNTERMMPYNHLQLRLEDLSSDPNTTLARVLEFLEGEGNGAGLVSRPKPAQESEHRKHPQFSAAQLPINPEQKVSRHRNDPSPDPRVLSSIVSSSSTPEESIVQGEAAWHRGDFPTAINTLGSLAESSDSVLLHLADALFKQGLYDDALVRFRQALASDENNAELWLGLAQTRLALGQRTEAAADLHRALDLGLAQPVRALAAMMSMAHDVLAPARAALERNPQDIGLLAMVAQIELAYGNAGEARAKAQRLSELVPDRVDLVTAVTEKLIEKGWLDEARTLLEPLARDIPEDPEVQHLVELLTAKANDDRDRTATVAQALDHTRPRSAASGLPRRALRFGKRMLKKLRSPPNR